MAKLLFSCSRDKSSPIIQARTGKLQGLLCPDNLQPRPSFYNEKDGSELFMFNPASTNEIRGMSVLLGRTQNKEWDKIGKSIDDGNFAIVRQDEHHIELVADATGSRTIWWYHDSKTFIAATSQRALLYCIPGFEVNRQAISWMLITGYTGPGIAWDKRLKAVKPGSRVILDRATWDVTVHENPPIFKPLKRSKKQTKKELRVLLDQAVSGIPTDGANVVIPLSGGYDSRAIVCMLRKLIDQSKIHTITWGVEEALSLPYSDAWIAVKLAKELGVNHQFLKTEAPELSPETKLTRFLTCSEGRIDNIGGYWDGMYIWNKLHSMNIQQVVRGEEGFGWGTAWSRRMVLKSIGIVPFEDDQILETWSCDKRQFPNDLERRSKESLATWRDRLYHTFRAPTVLAALSDIKFTFVEIDNPLLDNSIIHFVRTMRDKNRTEKKLFKEIVNAISPKVPYARYSAIQNQAGIMAEKETRSYIRSRLENITPHPELPEKMLRDVLKWTQASGTSKAKSKRSLKALLKPLIPQFAKQIRNTFFPIQIDRNTLILRVWIIVEMLHLFESDSQLKHSLTE